MPDGEIVTCMQGILGCANKLRILDELMSGTMVLSEEEINKLLTCDKVVQAILDDVTHSE